MKKYLLLTPILLACLSFIYIAYDQIVKLSTSQTLDNKITQQIAIKDLFRALLTEQKFVATANDNNQTTKTDVIMQTKAIVDEKIQNLDKQDPINSITSQLHDARENIGKDDLKSNIVFINFYENLNERILDNCFTFIGSNVISPNDKIYLISLQSIHSTIEKLLKDRKLIFDTLLNQTNITADMARNWLKFESIEDIARINLLDNITKDKALQSIAKNYGEDIIKELKRYNKEIIDDGRNLTKADMLYIDALKLELTILLTHVSDIIGQQLHSATRDFTESKRLLFFISVALTLLLGYSIILIYKQFRQNENTLEIALETGTKFGIKPDEISPANVMQTISQIAMQLRDKEEYASHLNELKNEYLARIASKNKKLLKDNLNALFFIKKELNDIEHIKATNLMEENFSAKFLMIENLAKIVDFKQERSTLEINTFWPQTTFKKALEANLYEIEQKHINYTTYVDPSIINELEGDENKIITAIANIIFGATAQCSNYAKLLVEIKRVIESDDSDVAKILISIKNDAKPMNDAKIQAILKDEKNIADVADYGDFWFALSNLYLKIMGFELDIKSTSNVGNEFSTILRLRIKGIHPLIDNKISKKVAFIEDNSKEYNEFFKKTMAGLELSFTSFTNDAKLMSGHDFDIVFTRNEHEVSSTLKNLINLKDPLTPLEILSFMQVNFDNKNIKFNASKPQILIIEDNNISLRFIEHAFKNYNVNLTTAINFESLYLPNAPTYDIIFANANLANINSLEAIRRLKDENANFKTPFIAMLSNTSQMSADKALSEFDNTITKPLSQYDLAKILATYIDNMQNFVMHDNVKATSLNILLYKKTPLENKIFSGALKEFKENLTVVDSLDEFEAELSIKTFGLVFIDENASDFDMNRVIFCVDEARIRLNIDTQLFIFSEATKELTSLKSYIRTLSPQINKTKLSNIIKNSQKDMRFVDYERERERERERGIG